MLTLLVAAGWVGFTIGVLVGAWWTVRGNPEPISPDRENPDRLDYWMDRTHPN